MNKSNRFSVVRVALFIALLVGLVLMAIVSARAQSQVSRNFIGTGGGDGNGATVAGFNGYLQIAGGQTIGFGSNNMVYSRGTIITNVLVAITNTANSLVITGYVSQLFPVWVTNANGISDVNLWGNRDGSVALPSISVDINGNGIYATNGTSGNVGSVTFTNVITFTFEAIYGGPGTVVGAGGPQMGGTPVANAAQNQWSFVANGNGTNDVYIATNPPAGFLQGAKALRLFSIASNQNLATTNGQIVGVWLNGWQSSGGSVAMLKGAENTYASRASVDRNPFTLKPAALPTKAPAFSPVASKGKILRVWSVGTRPQKVWTFAMDGSSASQTFYVPLESLAGVRRLRASLN